MLLIVLTAVCLITNTSQAADYKLTTGDELYISIWGHPDLEQNVILGPDGQISFPMVGKVEAAGLTINQLSTLMTDKLRKYLKIQESQVTIVFKKYKQLQVMVLGEVEQPGSYEVQKGSRVSDLLAKAGGTTEQVGDEIKYISGDKEEKLVLDDLLAGKIEDPVLAEGDRIQALEGKYFFQQFSFWRNLFFFIGGLNQIKNLIG